uniref:Uncharacterized protein n=1 Tax=Arundo donax TaxID=35708 RepID=A0A0A9AQU7_ARUDO
MNDMSPELKEADRTRKSVHMGRFLYQYTKTMHLKFARQK